MKLDELKEDLKKGDRIYKGFCHDCGAPVEVEAIVREDGAIVVTGGSVYKIKVGLEHRHYFKCDSCFVKDRVLKNYQDCEVYSRVVGYLRPVQQYNKGKKEEFKMRKEFINHECRNKKEVKDTEIEEDERVEPDPYYSRYGEEPGGGI